MEEKVRTLPAVIGTFEGECGDATVTNNNGLDIEREVWETLFASDDFKKGIELGWYIGFLGHPKDPDCMDFEHACIVMTEGHITDDGKIVGKFNLVDTPVGRIVLSFINAGVKFGISVRGAGDVVQNSVQPGTFIFRGFDLVIFPAYNNAIPTFSKIAASTDVKTQKMYKVMCSTLHDNIDSITEDSEIDILQSQFAPQSEEYALLESKRSTSNESEDTVTLTKDQYDHLVNRADSMLKLYLQKCDELKSCCKKSDDAEVEFLKLQESQKDVEGAMKRAERIVASQLRRKDKEIESFKNKAKIAVSATTHLKDRIESITKNNLKYRRKVEAATKELSEKDSIISGLQKELHETVEAATQSNTRASNLGEQVKSLKKEVNASSKMISEYQQAFASLYSSALGVDFKGNYISASTSVSQLQSMISGSTKVDSDEMYSEVEDVDVLSSDEDDEGMVTL